MKDWWVTTGTDALMVLASVVVVYLSIIAFTRIAGLRSFSQMSAFDFAMTIALGTIFASTVLSADPPVLRGLVGLFGLYACQAAIALGRRKKAIKRLVDNQPRLLMVNGELITDALLASRMTEDDLRAKLREANVLQYHQVRAVVLETTGDVSVLHANDATPLDPALLRDVQGVERLTPP